MKSKWKVSPGIKFCKFRSNLHFWWFEVLSNRCFGKSFLLTCPEDLLGKFHGFARSHSLWLYHQKAVLRGFNNSKTTPSSSKTSKESSNQVNYFKYFRNYYFTLVLKIWFHFEQGGKKWQKLTKYILATWQFDKRPSVWGTHIQGLKLTVQLKTIDGRYKDKTSLKLNLPWKYILQLHKHIFLDESIFFFNNICFVLYWRIFRTDTFQDNAFQNWICFILYFPHHSLLILIQWSINNYI